MELPLEIYTPLKLPLAIHTRGITDTLHHLKKACTIYIIQVNTYHTHTPTMTIYTTHRTGKHMSIEYHRITHRCCMIYIKTELHTNMPTLKPLAPAPDHCTECIRNPFPAELLPTGQPPTCIECISKGGVYNCMECINTPYHIDLRPDPNNPQCIQCIADNRLELPPV